MNLHILNGLLYRGEKDLIAIFSDSPRRIWLAIRKPKWLMKLHGCNCP